jgi:hypothetical protein
MSPQTIRSAGRSSAVLLVLAAVFGAAGCKGSSVVRSKLEIADQGGAALVVLPVGAPETSSGTTTYGAGLLLIATGAASVDFDADDIANLRRSLVESYGATGRFSSASALDAAPPEAVSLEVVLSKVVASKGMSYVFDLDGDVHVRRPGCASIDRHVSVQGSSAVTVGHAKNDAIDQFVLQTAALFGAPARDGGAADSTRP